MRAFKANLLSRASIPRNGVSSPSKLFTTSHPESKSKDSDRARVREFLHGKCKSGKINLHKASYFFDYMIHVQLTPPVSSFNILFTALVKNKHYGDVISLHIRMNSVGLLVDELCKCGKMDEANMLYKLMIHRGIQPDTYTYNILMDGYCLVGRIHDAEKLFVSMPSMRCMPNVVSYNVLFNGRIEIAWELFHRLPHKGLVPNVVTYSILINGICKEGELEKANSLLLDMEENGYIPNDITFNTLMRGFIQNNDMPKVVELLHKMSKRNVIPDATTFFIVIDLLGMEENYRECLNSLPSFPIQEPTKS
ncbi:hypothetical protein LWI28_012797 [Acer negundo]|uniref:Pentatricopeptide repeat-containing protein n=1 Tax=Acer negundo TaxID=4023 RepID=A0AAD5IQU4_ACENE|nr:hypothetical protein LWI28_012797 [Acer negundo]